jgi:DNA-binding transcriptional MocR family regulator
MATPHNFSDYGTKLLDVAPVSRLMASFSRDFRPEIDINVGVGYVNEATLPYEAVVEATRRVVDTPDVYRSSLNYGDPAGSRQLRAAITDMLASEALPADVHFIQSKQILIGTNGATSILEGLAQIMEPGLVITSDPVYYIYSYYLARKGYRVLALPEDAHGMVPERLEEALLGGGIDTHDLRFVYVVSISNPTSTILTNERRHQIVDIVNRYVEQSGNNVPLIFDQAYSGLIHDPSVEKQESPFRYDRNQLVFEVGTLSKILAPALRIGYILGPDGALMSAMQERNSDAGFSASVMNQQISAVLLTDFLPAQKRSVLDGYRERAVAVRSAIDEKLSSYIEEVRGGQAGFYFYITFKDIATDDQSDFYRYLSRTTGTELVDGPPAALHPRVAYIPGQYCVNPNGALLDHGRRSLRFSYGFEPMERLLEAVDHIAEAARYVSSRL